MWRGQTWGTRRETLLLLVWWLIITSLTHKAHMDPCVPHFTKFSRGAPAGSQFLDGGFHKRGGDFFQQGGEELQFLHRK